MQATFRILSQTLQLMTCTNQIKITPRHLGVLYEMRVTPYFDYHFALVNFGVICADVSWIQKLKVFQYFSETGTIIAVNVSL